MPHSLFPEKHAETHGPDPAPGSCSSAPSGPFGVASLASPGAEELPQREEGICVILGGIKTPQGDPDCCATLLIVTTTGRRQGMGLFHSTDPHSEETAVPRLPLTGESSVQQQS